MGCDNCANWTVRRRRLYENGDEIITYDAPAGKGHCDALGIDTAPTFHCGAFAPGWEHLRTERITGKPWEHWKHGPCPDCGGRGSTPEMGMCQRCYGTSRVRFYDDGYIGEEQTRIHPKEREAPQCTVPSMANKFGLSDTDYEKLRAEIQAERLNPLPPPDPFAGQGSL